MKILSAAQIRELDAYTLQHEPITSLELMERASASFTAWFTANMPTGQPIKIFCGTGNNGGDGLAIARMLAEKKYGTVRVYVVQYSDKTSPDFDANLNRAQPVVPVTFIRHSSDVPNIHSADMIIDAIFGSGLSRPATGIAAAVIDAINSAGSEVVAVDIPSGLFVDTSTDSPHVVRAAHTVSFQLPKLAFLLPQNALYVGEWHITDIGLHPDRLAQLSTNHCYTDELLVRTMIRKRPRFSHKGMYGHALLMAGSYGKMGAAVLSATACVRSGVGLLTLHIPRCGYEIMQIAVPEAMTMTDVSDTHIADVPDLEKYNTVGMGPGIGTDEPTALALEKLLRNFDHPIVLDADALNILAQNQPWLKLLPPNSILTPHPKEFERLAGKSTDEYERLQRLREFAQTYKIIVVLKGAYTAVAHPAGDVYFNSTGNPGMATGGTGDVLTGVITSLLAQKYDPFEAAVLGVYFHGLAGDEAAKERGYAGLIASDVVHHLPRALQSVGL